MTNKHKYFSHKIENEFGKFDSKQEYGVFLSLLHEQKNGHISCLHRCSLRSMFCLVQGITQTENRALKTKFAERTTYVEQPIYYTPDFIYYDNKDKVYVCLEVKSNGTLLARDYRLRKVLMMHKIMRHNQSGRSMWVFREVK